MAQNSIMQGIDIVVIGGSAGSLEVILKLLQGLRSDPGVAIVIVLHRKSTSDSVLVDLLSAKTRLPVTEAEEKEPIERNHIYIAPADYHLLIEKDKTFSLDASEKIYYSRPAIDATFESAAEVYGPSLIGVLLSGANADGVSGLIKIKESGGWCVVQEPDSAEVSYMPQQALDHAQVDTILHADEMARFINALHNA